MDPEEYEYMLGALSEDDGLGYDPSAEYLGAPIRARRAVRRGGLASYAKQLAPTKFVGSPPRGARQWPLGFPVASFVNAGPTTIQVQTEPQRVFKGQRLIIAVARSAAGVGGIITLDQVLVGAVDQRISGDPLPVEMFQPDATFAIMDLDPAQPGIQIRLQYTIGTALGVGETVDIATGLLGESLS